MIYLGHSYLSLSEFGSNRQFESPSYLDDQKVHYMITAYQEYLFTIHDNPKIVGLLYYYVDLQCTAFFALFDWIMCFIKAQYCIYYSIARNAIDISRNLIVHTVDSDAVITDNRR